MTQPKIEGTGHGQPRMAHGSDGSDHYEVYVDSEGVLRVRSADGDKIEGFESIVEEALENLNCSAGTNTLPGTVVPSGKVWKVTRLQMTYVGTVPSKIIIVASGLAGGMTLFEQASPVSGADYCLGCEVYMQAADRMIGYVFGATAGDDFYFRYAGVQMNAP